MMIKQRAGLAMLMFAAFAMSAAAQTVTGSGTTNTVPVFTGTATVGNSPIAVSGSNVGIGLPNPGAPLEVSGSSPYGTPSNVLIINSNTSGTNYTSPGYYGSLTFAGSGYTWGSIQTIQTDPYHSWLNRMGFFTMNGSGGSPVERMSIDNSGNVGIGTPGPDTNLTVIGSLGMWANSSAQGNARISTVIDTATGGSAYSGAIVFTPNYYNGSTFSFPERMRITSGGNVGIGMTAPQYSLDVAGQIHASAAVVASAGVTFPDGTTQTTAFSPSICGGDYAESVDVTGSRANYEPGDVLVIDSSAPGKFLKSKEPYSTAVLGIYSTKPGTVGRRQTTPKSADEVPMAMVGIVPTKVSAENGAIKPGDLLVSASIPGYAMKGTDRTRMLGAVIGKALGSLDRGTGVIEVGVTLQ